MPDQTSPPGQRPCRQPIVAGASPEERDPAHWPPELFEPIQRLLDESRARAGTAVRDSFDHADRRMTAREFVSLWNACGLKAMATVGSSGHPHVAPVHAEFVSGRLRSTVYTNAVRRRDLQANPHVALTTWAPGGAAAIVYGRAREVPGTLRDTRPGATGRARSTVALEIDITRIYSMKARAAE